MGFDFWYMAWRELSESEEITHLASVSFSISETLRNG
jgi:hypothetical protein